MTEERQQALEGADAESPCTPSAFGQPQPSAELPPAGTGSCSPPAGPGTAVDPQRTTAQVRATRKQPRPRRAMDTPPPLHRQTAEQLQASVAALGWREVGTVKRQPPTDAPAFLSHYAAFRGSPVILEGTASRWSLLEESGGAVGALSRWLSETPVETLTLRYDEASSNDLTFDAARRRPELTTFGSLLDRGSTSAADPTAAEQPAPKRAKLAAASAAEDRSWEYLQKLRIPPPDSAGADEHAGLLRLSRSLAWPAVPCLEGLGAEEKETNLWAGRCLSSQLHFDGYDNIHTVVSGEKLFVLFSPWELERLYPTARAEGALNNTSSMGSVLTRRQAPEKWPLAAGASCMLVIVRAPDAIYIPNGWWHEVLTPSFSVSVNTWFGSAKSATARLRPTKIYCFSAEYAQFVLGRIKSTEAAAAEEQQLGLLGEANKGAGEAEAAAE